MAAYVSHIVAKYDRGVVAKLVEKLYGEAAGGRGNGRLLTRHSTGVAAGAQQAASCCCHPRRSRSSSEACRGLRSAPQPTPKTGIFRCPPAGEGTALDEFHCTDSVADVAGWLKQETDARVAAGAPRKAHVMPLGAMLAAWVTANPLLPLEQAVAQLSH